MKHFLLLSAFKTIQKNSIYLKEIFCNIIDVFTVTFDQFSTSLIVSKKILLTPNFWMVVDVK